MQNSSIFAYLLNILFSINRQEQIYTYFYFSLKFSKNTQPIINMWKTQKQSTHYQYLLLKEQKTQLQGVRSELKAILKRKLMNEEILNWHKLGVERQSHLLGQLMVEVKNTEQGKLRIQQVKEAVLGRAKELYQFDSQRNYFLCECWRDSLNPPIAASQMDNCHHFISFYKMKLNKETKRVLWQKYLGNEENKMEFFKFDHHVCAYDLQAQLSLSLTRLGEENSMTLKENQKDIALKLLEWVVKKHNKVPNKSQQSLCLTVVHLYSHFTPSKLYILGAIYIGLLEKANLYFEPDPEHRLAQLLKVFELVDQSSYQLIQKHYLSQQRREADLNQTYEHFRMSLSSCYMPLECCQYLIDQLLIKRWSKLDMYIYFVIMVMIMSDDLEDEKNKGITLMDVLSPENVKKIIKLEDVIEAFQVIFQKIPPSLEGIEGTNRLLDQMIKVSPPPKTSPPVPIDQFIIHDPRQELKLSDLVGKT